MNSPELTTTPMPLTVRMRRSPFFELSREWGAQSHIVYNHTLLAVHFGTPEVDYRHLKRAVQLWDVGCERQIEIRGPEALRLIQMCTPRDISAMQDNQCLYIPTVDVSGGMTNDPVLLRVGEDRYWVSIADSDLVLYFKGLAAGGGLDVEISEPDVAPLAIQGPLADELVERVWGAEARALGFFRHRRVDVDGRSMILARSGYSCQGGFELYFEGEEGARELWDRLMQIGEDLDIRAGSPCLAERVEGGLLSYLSDITPDMTPFEAGLGRFCHVDRDIACLALDALRARQVPTRQVRPIEIAGDPVPPIGSFWPVTDLDGRAVGRISSAAWAWTHERNIAIGLVDSSHWAIGTKLTVTTPDGERPAAIISGFPGRSR